ncbi:hypothetical protein D8M04_04730 [Oceanobacillus piezotolerans]|uniref:Sporulation protein n=1 Tax=Oceanobacillus piezotolerans TaxID=2448030 RepID=A0A498DC27_9BACI|nr:YhcN/YlaJ family sporulation lipoprotein [Oceanobacillus piezotolerans]RLL46517.1 hypothetical protein D8M04_04730 [Oceanobacillus piezotolerans]
MYKKNGLLIILLGLFIIGGCTGNNNATQTEDISDPLNPDRETERNTEFNEKLGYVHFSKDEIDVEEETRSATIDRNQYADMITRTILQNDGFDEVATLVTDQEVLIAYEKSGDLGSEEAADIAVKTAESFMPRFFEVYVSDNPALIHDIQSLHNSTTNRNYDNTINQIIKEMKKTPQGMTNNK